MKKIILIILALAFSFNIYGGRHHLSFKVGTAYTGAVSRLPTTSISEKDYEYAIYKLQEMGSIIYGIDINDDLKINLGLNWTDKGFTRKVLAPLEYYELSLKSLEIPVFVDYEIFKNTKILFGGFITLPLNIDYIIKKIYPINIGLVLGVEYNYNNFLFDFILEQGLSEIYSPEEGEIYGYSTQIIFMVGYQFF